MPSLSSRQRRRPSTRRSASWNFANNTGPAGKAKPKSARCGGPKISRRPHRKERVEEIRLPRSSSAWAGIFLGSPHGWKSSPLREVERIISSRTTVDDQSNTPAQAELERGSRISSTLSFLCGLREIFGPPHLADFGFAFPAGPVLFVKFHEADRRVDGLLLCLELKL